MEMSDASLQSHNRAFDVLVSTPADTIALARLASSISIKNPGRVGAFGFSLNASQLHNLNSFPVVAGV